MDLSNMIQPALHRITSTFAITNNSYGGFINRVLSFTGSFNDRTSLLHHDAELGRPTQTEEAAAAHPPPQTPPPAALVTTAGHPFDVEAGTTTPMAPTVTIPQGQGPARQEEPEPATDDEDAEARRVGKSVQTVCLFAASASLVLFANLPSNKQQAGSGAAPPAGSAAAGPHGGAAAVLYSADMAFISLGFFSSLGLSMFSIVARPGEAAVARVQKWGMVVAVASVVVAFSLRVCMTPVA